MYNQATSASNRIRSAIGHRNRTKKNGILNFTQWNGRIILTFTLLLHAPITFSFDGFFSLWDFVSRLLKSLLYHLNIASSVIVKLLWNFPEYFKFVPISVQSVLFLSFTSQYRVNSRIKTNLDTIYLSYYTCYMSYSTTISLRSLPRWRI